MISGEKGCVDGIVVDDWKERLPDLISGYKPDDIYNMDETGLFYRALPDRTLALKGQECIGSKKAKERITLALCVSMTGEFERPLVIGRAAKPRCFKHLCLDKLPVTWKFNKKAWMTTELFNEWIGNFNKKMSAQNRKVLLMLDNDPSHPKKDLSNIKCLFLPANTTSVLQPLDQGIIQNVKMHYKRKLLNCALAKIETASSVVEVQKSVNVLDACQWAASAVSPVKSRTVVKCFAKAGVCPLDEEEKEDPDDDVPLVQLLGLATERLSLEQPLNIDEFLTLDDDVPATEELHDGWEEELAQEHDTREEVEDIEEEHSTDHPKPKNLTEALKAAAGLISFCTETERGYDKTLQHFFTGQEQLQKITVEAKCNVKQTTLDSFFSKT